MDEDRDERNQEEEERDDEDDESEEKDKREYSEEETIKMSSVSAVLKSRTSDNTLRDLALCKSRSAQFVLALQVRPQIEPNSLLEKPSSCYRNPAFRQAWLKS